MSVIPIDEAGIETAAKALHEKTCPTVAWDTELEAIRMESRHEARAAVSAYLETAGATVEYQSAWAFGAAECATAQEALDCEEPEGGRQAQSRVAFPWVPLTDTKEETDG